MLSSGLTQNHVGDLVGRHPLKLACFALKSEARQTGHCAPAEKKSEARYHGKKRKHHSLNIISKPSKVLKIRNKVFFRYFFKPGRTRTWDLGCALMAEPQRAMASEIVETEAREAPVPHEQRLEGMGGIGNADHDA